MIGFELAILSIYGIFVAAVILFQAYLAVRQFGLKYMLGPRDDRARLSGIAGRAERAAQNCVVALVLFAPAVLSVQVQGQNSALTLLAAQTFLVSRVVFVASYLAGIRYVRTLAFVAGYGATIYLYLAAL